MQTEIKEKLALVHARIKEKLTLTYAEAKENLRLFYTDLIKGLSEFIASIAFLIAAGLLIVIGFAIWSTLRDGTPASWYLGASLLILAVSILKSKNSAWFKFVRDTAGAASIGFLILTVVTACITPGDNTVVDDDVVQAMRASEFQLIHLHEQLEKFGHVVVFLVPLFLVALVFASRTVGTLKWAEKLGWFKQAVKLLLGGLAIASSFSMFASDSILGEGARQEKGRLQKVLTYVDKKEHEKLLEVARLRVETAALTAMTPSQKQFVAAAMLEAWQAPKLRPEARNALLLRAGEQVQAPDPAQPPAEVEQVNASIAERATAAGNSNGDPKKVLAKKLQESDSIDAFAQSEEGKYESKRREVVNEIVSSAMENGSDPFKKTFGFEEGLKPIKEGVSSMLGELFHVPDDVFKLAFDQLIDKLADTAYDKVTEPIVEKIRKKAQDRFADAVARTDPTALAHHEVLDALHYLGAVLPATLIERASDKLKRGMIGTSEDAAANYGLENGKFRIPGGGATADVQLAAAQKALDLFAGADQAVRGADPAGGQAGARGEDVRTADRMNEDILQLRQKNRTLHKQAEEVEQRRKFEEHEAERIAEPHR